MMTPKQEAVAERVFLVSLKQGMYLVVPIGTAFASVTGDTVDENGLSPERAKDKVISFFGRNASLDLGVWDRALLIASSGVKVTLELGEQSFTNPKGQFPICIREY
jgi:hypothetical protein